MPNPNKPYPGSRRGKDVGVYDCHSKAVRVASSSVAGTSSGITDAVFREGVNAMKLYEGVTGHYNVPESSLLRATINGHDVLAGPWLRRLRSLYEKGQ